MSIRESQSETSKCQRINLTSSSLQCRDPHSFEPTPSVYGGTKREMCRRIRGYSTFSHSGMYKYGDTLKGCVAWTPKQGEVVGTGHGGRCIC